MTSFLLKINGVLHGPGGICKPNLAAEWEGGEILMPWDGPRASSHVDRTVGPTVQPGDELFIWTHEDKEHGDGRGLTATAVVDAVRTEGDSLAVRLKSVALVPRPFGFRILGEKAQASPLLSVVDSDRRPRAWVASEYDVAALNRLIVEYGQPVSAAVNAAHVDHWSLALTEDRETIEEVLAERKTAITKARPGQQEFRANAMARHGRRCVFTGYRVPEAIEAAHVIPHTGHPQFERPDNSLVLRRDVHVLFDAFLLSINPGSGRAEVSPELMDTPYQKLRGRDIDHKLAKAALEFHFRRFCAVRDSKG